MPLFLENNIHHSSKKGATMIEIMGMLVILGLGVASVFSVIISGVYFAKDTEDTIKAINIAREGIEGVTNIRNTNWLRFTSDRINCWNVQAYDSLCIGGGGGALKLTTSSGTIYTEYGLWSVSPVGSTYDPQADWSNYFATYAVKQDADGFYNQTGSNIMALPSCSSNLQKNCRTIFTREIILSENGPSELNVKSIVYWNTKRLQKVELNTTLTNWKAKF